MLLLRRPSTQASWLLRSPAQHQHQRQHQHGSSIRCIGSRKKTLSWTVPVGRGRDPRRMRLRRSGADPRGREDAAATATVVLEPTRREMYVVALHQAVPFVGFGIMDNSILILAGEAIDINLGATLGISTMCAAAIGNIGADLCGVAFGTVFAAWIERMTSGRLKLPPMPQLSYDQRNLRSVKVSGQLGCAAGLTLGCVIGMFPLLFFSEDARSAKDKGGKDEMENDVTSPASQEAS